MKPQSGVRPEAGDSINLHFIITVANNSLNHHGFWHGDVLSTVQMHAEEILLQSPFPMLLPKYAKDGRCSVWF